MGRCGFVCEYRARRGQKRASGPWELSLREVVELSDMREGELDSSPLQEH